MAGPRSLGLGRALRPVRRKSRSSRVVIFMLIGEPGTMRDRLPESFHQLGIVRGSGIASLGVGIQQQLAAKHLRRLGFPQIRARDGLVDLFAVGRAFDRAGDRNGQNRGPRFAAAAEDVVDPLVGQAGRAAS